MIACSYNPNNGEAETGWSLGLPGQSSQISDPQPLIHPISKNNQGRTAPEEQCLKFPDVHTHAHTIVLIHIHTKGEDVIFTECYCYLLYIFVTCHTTVHSAASETPTWAWIREHFCLVYNSTTLGTCFSQVQFDVLKSVTPPLFHPNWADSAYWICKPLPLPHTFMKSSLLQMYAISEREDRDEREESST